MIFGILIESGERESLPFFGALTNFEYLTAIGEWVANKWSALLTKKNTRQLHYHREYNN